MASSITQAIQNNPRSYIQGMTRSVAKKHLIVEVGMCQKFSYQILQKLLIFSQEKINTC